MPSFLTWPTSSGIRLAPSRREYSLWVWRWTNGISVVTHESVSINPPLTSPVSTRALDSRGTLDDKVPRRVGKSGPGGEDLRSSAPNVFGHGVKVPAGEAIVKSRCRILFCYDLRGSPGALFSLLSLPVEWLASAKFALSLSCALWNHPGRLQRRLGPEHRPAGLLCREHPLAPGW